MATSGKQTEQTEQTTDTGQEQVESRMAQTQATFDKPVDYVGAGGRKRRVSSREGAIAAEYDGFYAPDSPSGKRLTAEAKKKS